MQNRVEIAQVYRSCRRNDMADANIFHMTGLWIEVRITMHICIYIIHIIRRRSLKHTSPRCIHLRVLLRTIVQRRLWRPMRAKGVMMIHAHARDKDPFIRKAHGILQVDCRRRDLLILIAGLLVRGIALVPFRARDELVVRIKAPAILIVETLHARLEFSAEI